MLVALAPGLWIVLAWVNRMRTVRVEIAEGQAVVVAERQHLHQWHDCSVGASEHSRDDELWQTVWMS